MKNKNKRMTNVNNRNNKLAQHNEEQQPTKEKCEQQKEKLAPKNEEQQPTKTNMNRKIKNWKKSPIWRSIVSCHSAVCGRWGTQC